MALAVLRIWWAITTVITGIFDVLVSHIGNSLCTELRACVFSTPLHTVARTTKRGIKFRLCIHPSRKCCICICCMCLNLSRQCTRGRCYCSYYSGSCSTARLRIHNFLGSPFVIDVHVRSSSRRHICCVWQCVHLQFSAKAIIPVTPPEHHRLWSAHGKVRNGTYSAHTQCTYT